MTEGLNERRMTDAWQKPTARLTRKRASAVDGRSPG
jgi:hypothetical protein